MCLADTGDERARGPNRSDPRRRAASGSRRRRARSVGELERDIDDVSPTTSISWSVMPMTWPSWMSPTLRLGVLDGGRDLTGLHVGLRLCHRRDVLLQGWHRGRRRAGRRRPPGSSVVGTTADRDLGDLSRLFCGQLDVLVVGKDDDRVRRGCWSRPRGVCWSRGSSSGRR